MMKKNFVWSTFLPLLLWAVPSVRFCLFIYLRFLIILYFLLLIYTWRTYSLAFYLYQRFVKIICMTRNSNFSLSYPFSFLSFLITYFPFYFYRLNPRISPCTPEVFFFFILFLFFEHTQDHLFTHDPFEQASIFLVQKKLPKANKSKCGIPHISVFVFFLKLFIYFRLSFSLWLSIFHLHQLNSSFLVDIHVLIFCLICIIVSYPYIYFSRNQNRQGLQVRSVNIS